MSAAQQDFYLLGVALAIGLLIGIERGWEERTAGEGRRIAGMRTYGLIGLLGGVVGLMTEVFGAVVFALAFIALAGTLTAVYMVNLGRDEDVGITSLIAGLLTFVFGFMAVAGDVAIAAAAAVVTTLLLSYKPALHQWLSTLELGELRAGIKLLIISVVLLPILPNRGYGPWQALNPYAIWWMVVLIALISFVGYFAVKFRGPRRGILFTGLFGGLASSTALTLHFSRAARRDGKVVSILATGILLACGTMAPRMLLVATVINPALSGALAVPAAAMAAVTWLSAAWSWRSRPAKDETLASPLRNPLELRAAMLFGGLLAAILVLGKALQLRYGDAGILALAAASGVTDVDAITLSLARMSDGDLTARVAVLGVVLAGAVNSLVKGGIAAMIGGREIGLRVGLPLAASAVAGLSAAWWWV
jgi:uncharacterized membrane protein (DUF4010 family)